MAKEKEPIIKTLATEAPAVVDDAPFTHYTMIALDEKGKEKGQEFDVLKKTFEMTFKGRTAKPEGTATKPKFKVKKKY